MSKFTTPPKVNDEVAKANFLTVSRAESVPPTIEAVKLVSKSTST